MKRTKITQEKEQHVIQKVAALFRANNKDVVIDKDGQLSLPDFFMAYHNKYKLTSQLVQQQEDRRVFFQVMDKFFEQYFTNKLMERVENGENRRVVEPELREEAAKYLTYNQAVRLAKRWSDLQFVAKK